MVEYGTIGIRPMGEWDPDIKYGLLNLVTLDGSSYVAHTEPPIGTLPTNVAYWQASAQGTGKATAGSVGTVKPDGVTTEVDGNGALSVKTANQSTAGIVKGSAGIKVGEGGIIDVNTIFEQATELANIIAGEAIASVFGKISKSIAVTMGLDQNALLKNMLTNIDANDQNKIPTSAFVHNLYERIGMGEDLDIGANLTAVVKALNNDLTLISNDLIGKIGTVEFYYESAPIASQPQLDALINNVYTTLNKTSGNLVYKILINISSSGLTIPGGTHLLSGYNYGNSSAYNGAQQILIRNTGIKSRSCAANTWSAWA